MDAVVQPELGEHPAQVGLHGSGAEEQGVGDLGAGMPGGDEGQDVALPVDEGGEGRGVAGSGCVGEAFDESAGDLGGEQGVAGVDGMLGRDEVLQGDVLEEECAGPGVERVRRRARRGRR